MCEDCLGTGLIEVETIKLGRAHITKSGELVTPYGALGNWHKAQCHCVGEEDYYD